MDAWLCLDTNCEQGARTALDLVRLAGLSFLAILFLQSGVDKIVDRKGNLEWLTGHFARSPLASFVGVMLGIVTVVELAAGLLSALGVAVLWLSGSRMLGALGACAAVLSILMLFFGQRLAKDYAGAAALVPYFIAACGILALMGTP